MRRALWVVIPAAVAALALTASAAAQTVAFSADVQASFGIRNSIQCPPDLDCGRARIVGFGKATRTLAITGFTPGVPSGCNSVTALEHRVLESDGSTLDLALDAALCNPGGSASANDPPGSPGDHLHSDGNLRRPRGTGAFAGATGGGTLTGVGAGDGIVIHYTGTLTLS
jgi:hypothetical protein